MPTWYYKPMSSKMIILLAGAIAACLVIISILAYLCFNHSQHIFEGTITSPEAGSALDGAFLVEYEITETANCTYQQLLIDNVPRNNWTSAMNTPRPLNFSFYSVFLSDGGHNITMSWKWDVGGESGTTAACQHSVSVKVQNTKALVSFAVPGNRYANFTCEIADTAEEQQLGLMYRDLLAQDSGMLFVFESARSVTFWMKNTEIPLDIIFIGANGRVLNVEEADPEPGVPDEQLARYTSSGSAKWVIEINQGLCSTYGIVPGTAVAVTLPE